MTDRTPRPGRASSPRRDRPDGRPVSARRAQLLAPLVDLTIRTQNHLQGADGVGITLLLADDLTHVGSNTFTDDIDDVQYGVMQGPCLSAHLSGQQVRSDTIGTSETRWPSFTPRASDLDLRSVVSCPLVSAGSIIGSLNLYAKKPAGFVTLEPATATAAARTVGESVSTLLLVSLADVLGGWFMSTMNDRGDVERASGALMDRYHLRSSQARLLVEQIAHEDQVSEATAARSILRERP